MAGKAATNLTNFNINETYYGVLHAGGQNLPATGQAQIFDGYGTNSAIKIGANCNGVTVCGPLSASSLSLATPLSASTEFDILNLLNVLHPIGSIIFTYNGTNPGSRSGWNVTTWTQVSQGRFIVGVGTGTDISGESKNFISGNNEGEYKHILTIDEMPSHTHKADWVNSDDTGEYGADRYRSNPGAWGFTGDTDSLTLVTGSDKIRIESKGGNNPHNNLPPGFGLYVWQRTA